MNLDEAIRADITWHGQGKAENALLAALDKHSHTDVPGLTIGGKPGRKCASCGVLYQGDPWCDTVTAIAAKVGVTDEPSASPTPETAELRTPTEWAAAAGIRIHAIDGWKRDGKDFTEPITRAEFDRRVQWCSVEGPVLKPGQDIDLARTLATVWPDPFGAWTAEQADAARAMKAAILRTLGVPERHPRTFTATDPNPGEEGLVLRDENGDEAEYRDGAWRWRVIDRQRVTGDDLVPMAGPIPDLSYPATEVLPAVTTTRGMR